MILVVYTI